MLLRVGPRERLTSAGKQEEPRIKSGEWGTRAGRGARPPQPPSMFAATSDGASLEHRQGQRRLSNPRRETRKLFCRDLTELVKRSPQLIFRAESEFPAARPVLTTKPQDHKVAESRVPCQVPAACVHAEPVGVQTRMTTALARAAVRRSSASLVTAS